MRTIIVTASDSGYYPLLQGMVRSIHQHAPDTHIGVIDCLSYYQGSKYLSRTQKHWLHQAHYNIEIRRDPETSDKWEHFFRQLMWRGRLPSLFPGFDCYIWLDADAWLQTPHALIPYTAGAIRFDVAAVSDADRCAVLTNFGGGTWRNKLTEKFYGDKVAKKLAKKPMLFGTSFAAMGTSRFWPAFQASLDTAWAAMKGRKPIFGIDQIALTHAAHCNKLKLALLPFKCCYHVGYRLPWVNGNGLLCEPYPPFDTLEVVHVIGDYKYNDYTLTSLGGVPVVRNLHFGGST